MKNQSLRRLSIVLSSIAALAGTFATTAYAGITSVKQATAFYNPIMDGNADPWMTHFGSNYYMTATTGSNITIWKSNSITNVATGLQKTVWSPSGNQANLQDIWSPQLHRIGNRWYIYFAADKNGDNATHRDYVLESVTNNPMGAYRFIGEIHDPANQWMIDPTILTLHHRMYFLWSGWKSERDQTQRLFIAPMSSPTKISGEGVIISSPTYSWETSVAPINEGPVVLQHGGKTFIVYSANASWTNAYCLGLLILKGTNPLHASDWVKSSQPVFSSTNQVFGPGRASFVTSEDGKQNWMIYHAARYDNSGWDRTIRAQPFTWKANGMPDFGRPLPTSQAIQLPSGEKPNRNNFLPVHHNGFVMFTVSVPKAGTYGLYIRYDNTTGMTATQSIELNGHPELPLSIPVGGKSAGPAPSSTLDSFISLPKGKSVIKISENSYTANILALQLTLTPGTA